MGMSPTHSTTTPYWIKLILFIMHTHKRLGIIISLEDDQYLCFGPAVSTCGGDGRKDPDSIVSYLIEQINYL